MIRTQIQLTERQAAALRELATRRKLSVAALVREGVDGLMRAGHSGDDDERRRRARAVAGCFRSGRGDLSAAHDAHLAEAYERR